MLYKQVEYLQSTGTQYVDTNVVTNKNTNVEIKCEIMASGTQGIFGVGTNGKRYLLAQQQSNACFIFDFNSSSSRVASSVVGYNNGSHILKVVNKEFFVDNVSYGTSSGINYTNTLKSFLFGSNGGSLGKVKIYYCKIYDNGVLVRDFIPVKDSNNVACLYDRVEKKAYYNQGTGTFTAGNYLYDDLIYDRTQEDVEYALSNPDSLSFLKGAYNYTDLNRIEKWCDYIEEQLNEYSYNVDITTKTDWTMDDFPTKAQLERIRSNVQDLKEAFIAFTTIPDNLEKMTYQKANNLEKVLSELDILIDNMILTFYYSGEIYSGEVY